MSSPSGRSGDDGDARSPLPGDPSGEHRPRHLAGDRGVDDQDEGDARRDAGQLTARTWPASAKVATTVLEWVAVIGCGIVIALVAQAYLVQAFWIPSPSMTPTLDVEDRVLVNKLSYRTHDVHRGDVVVFERPPEASNGEDGEIKDLIKRVVAVGGDTLEARDGEVYVNGERIEEPYLAPDTLTDRLPRQEIPEGHVFVMGDNRTDSQDSRVFGPIDEDAIVGRAVFKVLPLTDMGWL